jgi:sugar (glycoside-pentoside-hexuronide) transporter
MDNLNNPGYDVRSADVQLKLGEKLSYSFGCGGIVIIMFISSTFMNFFWTDVLMIPIGIVGTFLLVNKVWDAINDPIIGALADRTTTKYGRYRPWIWAFIPMIVFGFLMYVKLPGSNMTVQCVFTFCMYFLYILSNTGAEIPHVSLMSTMTTNYKARGVLASFRQTTASVSVLVISACFLPLVLKLGDGDQAKGLPPAMLIFLAATIPLCLICFFGVRERVIPQAPKEKFKVWESFKVLKGNLPALMVAVIYLVWGAQSGFASSSKMYFFTYVAGDVGHFAVNMTYFAVGGLVANFLMGFLMAKTKNKRNVGMMGWVVAIILNFIMYFIDVSDPSQLIMFDVLTFFNMFFAMFGVTCVFTLTPDVTEHTQILHGARASGFLFAIINFAQKLGTALAQGVFSWIIAARGYAPGGDQPEAVISAMRSSVTLWPGLIMIIGVIAFYFYKLDKSSHEAALKELEKK